MPTLVVVGAATRDLDATDARGWRLGGTVAYASLAAATLGIRVRALVGADDEASRAVELELLRETGVDIHLVALERGPVFDNRQRKTRRVQVIHEISDTIAATDLPANWADSDAVLLGPVAAELADDWATAFPASTYAALTWQGLLRRLVAGQAVEPLPPTRSALVDRADALLLSSEDARAGAPPLHNLLHEGQQLLLTHGERGALSLRLSGGRLRGRLAPALRQREAVDATGAGDVFLVAWLSARLLTPDAGDARHLAVAAAMAGLKVEARGLGGVPSRSQVCERLLMLRDGNRR